MVANAGIKGDVILATLYVTVLHSYIAHVGGTGIIEWVLLLGLSGINKSVITKLLHLALHNNYFQF